jgi:hypothetical protein
VRFSFHQRHRIALSQLFHQRQVVTMDGKPSIEPLLERLQFQNKAVGDKENEEPESLKMTDAESGDKSSLSALRPSRLSMAGSIGSFAPSSASSSVSHANYPLSLTPFGGTMTKIFQARAGGAATSNPVVNWSSFPAPTFGRNPNAAPKTAQGGVFPGLDLSAVKSVSFAHQFPTEFQSELLAGSDNKKSRDPLCDESSHQKEQKADSGTVSEALKTKGSNGTVSLSLMDNQVSLNRASAQLGLLRSTILDKLGRQLVASPIQTSHEDMDHIDTPPSFETRYVPFHARSRFVGPRAVPTLNNQGGVVHPTLLQVAEFAQRANQIRSNEASSSSNDEVPSKSRVVTRRRVTFPRLPARRASSLVNIESAAPPAVTSSPLSHVPTLYATSTVREVATLLEATTCKNQCPHLFSDVPISTKPCKCKNTRCLKLYCSCFQSGVLCNAVMCKCQECANIHESVDREMSIIITWSRNKKAFAGRPKKKKRQAEGCACKKTRYANITR